MENNFNITTNDFETICRTCLSRQGLNPLNEKYLAMLMMTCTVVKFAENDGLPAKLCTNCMGEIKKAFSFANRCETSDKILRKCLLETEVTTNLSYSQKVQPTIKTEEDIKPAIIYRTVKTVLGEYECMEDVKQEEDVKMEFDEKDDDEKVQDETCSDKCLIKLETEVTMNLSYSHKVEPRIKTEEDIKPAIIYRTVKTVLGEYECMEDVKQEEDVKMEFDEKDDDEKVQDETCSDKCLIKLETEVTMNLSYSHKVEPRIKTEEEIKPAIIYRTVKEVVGEYECMEDVKQEEDVKMEFDERDDDEKVQDETYSPNPGVRNALRWCTTTKIEKNSSKTDDCESYEGSRFKNTTTNVQINDDEGFEKSNNSGSRPRRRCTVSRIVEKSSNVNGSETYDDPGDKSYEEGDDDDDQGKTYSEKHVNASRNTNLKRHMRLHSGQKRYICKVCNKGFTRNETLKVHVRVHTGEKPFACKVCNKDFTVSGNLKTHMRAHSGEKPFACKVCNKGFTGSGNLKRHMRAHSGEKPFACKVCNKGFTQSNHLKEHMRVHTGEKSFACKVCNKGFNRSDGLKEHMRVHTGEKPFACKVCNKSFTGSGNLKRHMRVHTGEKPFACKVCNKGFTGSGNLKRHMRAHSGEKPFACKVCNKGFTQSNHLKEHMRVHTGEKSFACKVCNKGFNRSDRLKEHMRIHTGESYTCDVCSKSFSHSSTLQSHIRIHTGEKPCTCDICSKAFSQSWSHREHMRIHTKV